MAGAPAVTPVCRPRLPDTDALTPYLRQIDQNGWYSNFGPLESALTGRFAEHLGLARDQVLLTGSGTAALTAALIAAGRPGRPRCLMPSWTFAAGVGAAMAARLTPHFCDVDPESWALDPAALGARSDLADVGAVMVVCPFGDALDTAAWDAFTHRTGVPVIVDAAAAFGALDARALAVGHAVLVVSLHATKTFGIGEGGLLLCRDAGVVERATAAVNFGFQYAREAQLSGLNGKLSEYGAAVGHAALDRWPADRDGWLETLRLYGDRRQAFARHGALRLPVGRTWPASTLNWMAENAGVATAAESALAAAGIDTRRWWGDGCHRQPAYDALPRDLLPVTEAIAGRCLGLPLWRGLAGADVDRIAAVLDAL